MSILRRITNLFHRSELDQEIEAELRSHIEMRTADNIAAGMSPKEARRDAHLRFGSRAAMKERVIAADAQMFLDSLWQDLCYGLRQLRRSPGFSVVAVLTLALGIGANTAIFSVLDAVVLRPLPFASPNRLVHLTGKFALGDMAGISGPDYLDYQAANRTFEQMAVLSYQASISNLSGHGKPEQVRSLIASWNIFETLGIKPLLGRSFGAADEQTTQPQVAILSKSIWRGHFGSDAEIVGKQIVLDDQNLTVVGVLSSDPTILSPAQIWMPLPLLARGLTLRLVHFLVGVGKLGPGVTLEQAQADLDSDARVIDAKFPETNKGWGIKVRSLRSVLIGPDVEGRLRLISIAVGLLLLIACANVANFLLSRGETRRRELAVRRALGASRRRIMQQMLTESLVLACGGGAVGLFVAAWGVAALRAVGPADLPRLNEIHIGGTVLAFTAAISFVTAMLFGLAPALHSSQVHFVDALKQAGRGVRRSRKTLGNGLVVGQIAISLGLLVGGGLLLQSFWRMIHVNPGFQTQNVVAAKIELPNKTYGTGAKASAFLQQFEEHAGALPGVQAVGATSELPLAGEMGDRIFRIEGRVYGASQFEDAETSQTTPGYFQAMQIPLLVGRSFRWNDNSDAPPVIDVDEAFVKRYFPGESPIGKRLLFPGPGSGLKFTQRITIVGVVGNVTHDSLDAPVRPDMYVPVSQSAFGVDEMEIIVRTAANPLGTAAALQSVVSSLNKSEALSQLRTMQDVVASSVSEPRFSALLVGIFAALALGLAAVGLYGVIAYSVSQRTNEIGIRMALGAKPTDILRMVIGGGIKLALIGAAIGIALALSLGRFLQSLLFEIRATDPTTLTGVSLLLLAVAVIACYIPARRAMRVDPMVALRYE
jgi:putative ABC transport system permease protein